MGRENPHRDAETGNAHHGGTMHLSRWKRPFALHSLRKMIDLIDHEKEKLTRL